MNPLIWRHEHQLALLVGLVIGIIVGLLVGFMYEGFHYATLDHWQVNSRFRWGILGAVVGVLVIYAQGLLRTDWKP
jgi:H+/Cl- antiporter ClcA